MVLTPNPSSRPDFWSMNGADLSLLLLLVPKVPLLEREVCFVCRGGVGVEGGSLIVAPLMHSVTLLRPISDSPWLLLI